MKILTAIQNKEINEKINKIENIEILNTDIQYKEGIIEYLENNSKIDLIILLEELPGEISINELINNIQKINNKIKIIILRKKEKNKIEEMIKENKNIKYICFEKINYELIFNIIKEKQESIKQEKTIIKITGTNGVGTTVISSIISEILIEKENKKVLLIDDTENKTLTNIYKKIYNISILNKNEKIIKIKENLYILDSSKINECKIIEENNFNYIIIDSKNFQETKYKKIINKIIFIIEPNLIGIEKINKIKLGEKEIIILNKKTKNSIYEKTIENVLNKKIIEKINFSENIDLFINNNFDLSYLKNIEIKKFFNIINKIKE